MLNDEQKNNLKIFLSRVELKGAEAEALVSITNVLFPRDEVKAEEV